MMQNLGFMDTDKSRQASIGNVIQYFFAISRLIHLAMLMVDRIVDALETERCDAHLHRRPGAVPT